MTIAIRQIIVPREHRYIAQGQAVRMSAQIIDQTDIGILLTPSEVPLISLYDPLSMRLINDVDMTFVSKGLYTYTYQTLSTSPLGVYTANFTALHASTYARIERISVFKITKGSLFSSFTYFGLQDQTGVVWYYHDLVSGSLQSSLTIPSYPLKTAVSLSTTVPSWVAILNLSGQQRYIYPLVDGTLAVTSTQPPIGFGYTSVVQMVSLNGLTFQWSLDLTENIVFL